MSQKKRGISKKFTFCNPVQVVPEGQGVSGFCLSVVYGKNAFLTGLDLSLVGM